MAWLGLSFSVSQILTASQMNQVQENIRDVRRAGLGSSPPSSAEAGVGWWDNSNATYWVYKVYDGSDWVSVLSLDTSQNEGNLAVYSNAKWGAHPVVVGNELRCDFTGPMATPKNMLLNGNFKYWQRGNSFAVSSTRAYYADRWMLDNRGSFNVGIRRVLEAPERSPSRYSCEIQIRTPMATLQSGNILSLVQPIEGLTFNRTLYGTQYGQVMRMSGWFWSGVTGLFSFYLANASRNVTHVAQVNVNVASTWSAEEVGFVACLSGSWLGDTGCGCWVGVVFAAHNSFRTDTPGAWVLGSPDVRCVSGQLNGASTSGTIFRVADLQLELGQVQTPFDDLPVAFELPLLRRYYQKTFDLEQRPRHGSGQYEGTIAHTADNIGQLVANWPCLMRSNPSVSMFTPMSGGTAARWYNWTNDKDGKSGSVLAAGDSGIILTGVGGTLSQAAFDKMLIHATADAEIY
jgi:hypothetical protein